jgi:DnaJ-class molecular chaperone
VSIFKPKSGTGPYADRTAITQSARRREPRAERRVTCTACNGAGQVTTGTVSARFPGDRQDVRQTCTA